LPADWLDTRGGRYRASQEAKRQCTLEAELKRLSFIPVIVVDLCRYRDYADIVATASLNSPGRLGFSLVSPAGLSA
jgi:hypothetical protein